MANQVFQASVVLVSSNPTNLVLSGAFSLSFVKYTAHVILPFLAAAILVYPILLFALFRKRGLIPNTLGLELDDRDSNAAASGTLVDKHGAIFGSILLFTTLAVLVGTSTIGVSVWQVTVPPALVMLLRDGVHDWMSKHKSDSAAAHTQPAESPPSRRARSKDEFPMTELSRTNGSAQTVVEGENITEIHEVLRAPLDAPTDAPTTPESSTAVSTRSSSPTPPETLYERAAGKVQTLCETFPTVTTIASRLPLPLLPFAFLMFILVQALSSKGWVEVFARWWAAWVAKTGTIGAIGGMGFLACIFCNASPFHSSLVLMFIESRRYVARILVRRFCSHGSSKTGSHRHQRAPPARARATVQSLPLPLGATTAHSRSHSLRLLQVCSGGRFCATRAYTSAPCSSCC